MVRCGACQQPTVVPDSNLSNSLRATKLSATAAVNKVKASASAPAADAAPAAAPPYAEEENKGPTPPVPPQ